MADAVRAALPMARLAGLLARAEESASFRALADRAADSFGQYLTGIMSTSNDARTEVPLGELREGTPAEVSYRIAGGLGIDAAERQRLLETGGAASRLESIIRLLERENALLKELLLRLRARGEAPPLN